MKKFWTNASGFLKLDPGALLEFLKENGFGLLNKSSVKGTVIVKIDGRVVIVVSPADIRKFCWEYATRKFEFTDPEEEKQVTNLLFRERSIFNKDNMQLLSDVMINEIEDTQDVSYLFFKNCILIITAEKIEKVPHEKVNGHFFATDIIDFNLQTEEFKKRDGLFRNFLLDISSHANQEVAKQNFESLASLVGFILHRYKDPANPRSLILLDPYRGEGANGGAGKSLLAEAFEKIRSTVTEDGKRFHTNDRFALSNVNYDTRILVLDDIPERFDFTKLFPLISERAVVEKKYQDKFVINYEKSPKIVITTNYTIDGDDESSKRRKVEFILSDVFNSKYGPIDKYGVRFFEKWSDEEWENFYVAMALCIKHFLKNGIKVPRINVAERTLKMNTPSEFIEYADKNFKIGVKYNKRIVYDDFYAHNPKVYEIAMKGFHAWLSLYARAHGYNMKGSHSGSDNFFEYSLE